METERCTNRIHEWYGMSEEGEPHSHNKDMYNHTGREGVVYTMPACCRGIMPYRTSIQHSPDYSSTREYILPLFSSLFSPKRCGGQRAAPFLEVPSICEGIKESKVSSVVQCSKRVVACATRKGVLYKLCNSPCTKCHSGPKTQPKLVFADMQDSV